MDRPARLIPLADCASRPVGRVGRKAAVLAWAVGAGMRTPGGVVLPADRFWSALDLCGALERARYLESTALRLDPRHVIDLAASVAAALRSPEVAALAAEDGREAFDELGRSAVGRAAHRVVCRSSAAMEDGRLAAFPGVFLSVLGMQTPDALAAAIVECWRSAFSADAMRYLLRLRVEPVDLSLALMIQPQVEAAWSGVYVSDRAQADLSDAGTDAVVSGRVATVRAARRPDGRWAGVDAAPGLETALEAVHRAASRLAGHLGSSVDVEFALPTAAAEPVILQCRPLTPSATPARRVVGMAFDPHGDGDPAGVAVADHLPTADYGVVFRAAAVVLAQEVSPLSHVAILCRELGVPLVCGVPGAPALIGRRVAVEGRTGVVEIVHDQPTARGPATPVVAPPARAMPAVELLLRVLVGTGPGQSPASVAARLAGPCTVVAHAVDPADIDELQRLGTEMHGPSFSATDLLSTR